MFQKLCIFLPHPLFSNILTYDILIFPLLIYPVFILSLLFSQPPPCQLVSFFIVTSWYICHRLLLFLLLLLFQYLFPVPSHWSLFYFSLLFSLSFSFLSLSVCILHILFLKLPDSSSLYPLTFNFLFLKKKINSFFPFLSSSFQPLSWPFSPLSQGTWGPFFPILLAISHSFFSKLLFSLQTGFISSSTQPGTIVLLAQVDHTWIRTSPW